MYTQSIIPALLAMFLKNVNNIDIQIDKQF